MLSSGGWLSATSFEMSPVVLVGVEGAVVVGPKSDMVGWRFECVEMVG